MYQLQDSEQQLSLPEKRPITEVQAGSSEPFKRVRLDHEEPEQKVHSTEHEEGPSDPPPPANTKQGKRDAAGWAKSRRGKAKDTKNKGRRRGTRDPDAQDKEEGDEQGHKAPRLPKKQSALLIGFCGTGCNGMQMYAKISTSSYLFLSVFFSVQHCHIVYEKHFILFLLFPALLNMSMVGIRQPDVRTIEGVLFDALVRAGAVSKDNADDPVKVGCLHDVWHVSYPLLSLQVSLGRAARTDAGVHAAGNLVSMKLITAIPGVEDFVARINEELPPEIRVWGSVCGFSYSERRITLT
jgi:tRNA pseudouridine38-40 synthase